jgi:fatty acid desaturase
MLHIISKFELKEIMKKNMGNADRLVRIIIAVLIASLVYFNVLIGTLAIVLLALAIIFLLTSFISFCPLYTIFGASTCKKI